MQPAPWRQDGPVPEEHGRRLILALQLVEMEFIEEPLVLPVMMAIESMEMGKLLIL